MAESDKEPMSMFDRRRAGRGDNVKFTVGDSDLGGSPEERLSALFNDRSSNLGGPSMKLGGKALI